MSLENFIEVLIEIALNLYINLGRISVFTILSLPVRDYSISIHLFRDFLNIFNYHFRIQNLIGFTYKYFCVCDCK